MTANSAESRPSDWLPVNALCLAPEQVLPTDLWTTDGRLLLAKGQQLGSHDQIRTLDSHRPGVRLADAPAWRVATGDRAATPPPVAAPPRQQQPQAVSSSAMAPGLYGRWLDLHGSLHLLLRRGAEATDFLKRIDEIGARVATEVDNHPDESLFILVQLLYDGQSPYCASNALAAATLTQLLGQLANLPAPTRRSLLFAALTMNTAMARLQDELAV